MFSTGFYSLKCMSLCADHIFIGSAFLGSVNSIAKFSTPSNSAPLASLFSPYGLVKSFISNLISSWYSHSTVYSLYLSK
jgi:hypothetical protein